jgi:hypothetical protein
MMALTILRYTLLLLIPAYFIALSRRWWVTMPLWLVSTAVMLTQFLMAAQDAALGSGAANDSFIYVGEMTKIMLIPIVVQFAVMLHGMGVGVGRRPGRVSQKLIEAFDAGER